MQNDVSGAGALIIIVVLAAIYFLPGILAFGRSHRNAGAVLAFNLFLGWTFLGWVLGSYGLSHRSRRNPSS